MSPKLSGKIALITGASRGIGKSVAEAFAREGARLFLVGYVDEATLRQTLAEMRESGSEAEGGLFDVGNYDEVKRLADTIAQRYGTLDILVNDAGNIAPTPLSAKADIIGFTTNAARKLLPFNIHVNAVLPVARRRMTDALAEYANFVGQETVSSLKNLPLPSQRPPASS